MARYIDADISVSNIKGIMQMGCYPYSMIMGMLEAIHCIEAMQTADVQEVRRGEWKPLSDDDQDEGVYLCSECGCREFFPCYDQLLFYNFCPNCGAKMDGKDGQT